MSEKRFRANFEVSIYDSETEEYISASGNGLKEIAKRMNEQQAIITELEEEIRLLKPTNIEQYEQIQKLQEENEQLQAQLREKEQDERLYANEIVKLNKEAKEVLDFKTLGGDY